jgi:aerobic-type carbon monoxide dehydrogenase small subunit (CoxS/CutS family)
VCCARTGEGHVNGVRHQRRVEARLMLVDFLRHELNLTGTLGANTAPAPPVPYSITGLYDGLRARSCLLFAPRANLHEIVTIEGPAPASGGLHPLREVFAATHALQCDFCAPGFLIRYGRHSCPKRRDRTRRWSVRRCRAVCAAAPPTSTSSTAFFWRRGGWPGCDDRPLSRRSDRAQRGPPPAHRPGIIRRRCRTARDAARRLPAQPPR